METYKPQKFEERKSQKLGFWDFTKERLFWGALPFLTGGALILAGKLTNFASWPFHGGPDILTWTYAKAIKFITKEEVFTEKLANGKLADEVIEDMGFKNASRLRKHYYNFVRGAEVATPFSAYFLWHKKEGNRLDLQEVGDKLRGMQDLKPSDKELAEQNAVMRKEIEFAAKNGTIPPAFVDKAAVEQQGRLVENQKERA